MALCIKCGGSGLYMGQGMILDTCKCDDVRPINIAPKNNVAVAIDKIDKRSKSYKSAINDLMQSSNLNRDDAIKLFDETYNKQGC
jgi:hypothetical protein